MSHHCVREVLGNVTPVTTPANGTCRPATHAPSHSIRREVLVLKKLKGSLNIVKLEDVYEDDECVHVVMELCKGGELWHRIGDKHYSERTVSRFTHTGPSVPISHPKPWQSPASFKMWLYSERFCFARSPCCGPQAYKCHDPGPVSSAYAEIYTSRSM